MLLVTAFSLGLSLRICTVGVGVPSNSGSLERVSWHRLSLSPWTLAGLTFPAAESPFMSLASCTSSHFLCLCFELEAHPKACSSLWLCLHP